ncbi:MAG: hypothetical protein HY308_06220 [Gammaproteobacteria bacterium]|nr:hypothetical protein [Gammaproteobacteria bacterium]
MQTFGEGERRIRAAVRALMSQGLWLLIVAQFFFSVLLRQLVAGEDKPEPFTLMVLGGVGIAGLFYLMAGISRAFAQSRDVVNIGDALQAGIPVYGPFLWLMTKAGLVMIVIIQLVQFIALGLFGTEPGALTEQTLHAFALSVPALGFLFVYWFPVVFVGSDFRLLPTLRSAVLTLWQRLPQSMFPALLTLAPAMVLWVFDDSLSWEGLAAVDAIGTLMGWIAYIYCAERLAEIGSG